MIPTGDGTDHTTIQQALNNAFPRARLYQNGNFATIFASIDDDANSADHTMNVMDELMPQALILGGMSHSDLSYLRLGQLAYLHSPEPQLQPMEQKLFVARKRLSNYFEYQVQQASHIFYYDEKAEEFDLHTGTGGAKFYSAGGSNAGRDFRLYEAISAMRRRVWLSQLTAARMQCSMYDKKLFFGKASPLLSLEHLAATRSLAELREVFNDLLEIYKERARSEMWWPPSAPIDLHMRLKEVGAQDFTEVLYGEQLDLQASLTNTCTKLYNKEVLTLVDFPTHVEAIKKRCMNSKEASELKEIDEIYQRNYDLSGSSLTESIEKLAILSHIFSREFQNFTSMNKDEHSPSEIL